ncbi:hypothetical protein [Streptomyces broussonetiae]|uniref:hypothetical protein n=1 Tax=Streptomyces broussonetiae TaxID=2686304 RepID=UPI001E3D8F22|nr:hypothetical protein [Streptomyces broussonetiae]
MCAGPQRKYTAQQQPPAGSCHYRYEKGEPLPDLKCTPGATSPAVTQANLAQTICRKGGYTKGIRPPVAVTGKEKKLNAASYGYTGSLGDTEYDHDIGLQLHAEGRTAGHRHGLEHRNGQARADLTGCAGAGAASQT